MSRKNTLSKPNELVGESDSLQIISVTAGKGGVGKTNLASNLAIQLAKLGRKVVLFDADLSLANVDVLLGLHPRFNLGDVIAGVCSLKDIIAEGPHGIKIIPATSGDTLLSGLSNLECSGIVSAFNEIASMVDVLIVDTAGGLSQSVMTFSAASQERIIVLCDEPTSLTDSYALIKALKIQHGVSDFKVLVNMTDSYVAAQVVYKKLERVCEKFLDVNLTFIGYVPFDKYIKKAVQRQKAFVDVYPNCRASKELERLATDIIDWPSADRLERSMSFFVERLVNKQL